MNQSKKIIRDILPFKTADSKISDFKAIPKEKGGEKDFLKSVKTLKETNPAKNSRRWLVILNEIKRSGQKKLTKILITAFLLILGGGAAFYFLGTSSSVTVKIVPVSKIVSVNAFLKAAETGGDIGLELIKFQLEKDKDVKAGGAEKIEKKAKGTIVIYNSLSASQTLIEKTRFETSDGKIYRINKGLTVPGAKFQNGKLLAGSIETIVYADKAGEEYNVGLADFVLPALKEKKSPKYEKIYGRSKTPMEGGFIGIIPKVNENDLKSSRGELEKELEKEIFSKITSEIGEEAFFIKEGVEINFSYEIASSADNSKGTALLKEKAEVLAPVFQKDTLAGFLMKKYLKGTEFEKNGYLKNFEKLSFNILKKDLKTKEMTLKIDGEVKFAAKIDEDKLKQELIQAKNKKDVFKAHPEIDSGTKIIFASPLKIRFPKDSAKIKIEIELE